MALSVKCNIYKISACLSAFLLSTHVLKCVCVSLCMCSKSCCVGTEGIYVLPTYLVLFKAFKCFVTLKYFQVDQTRGTQMDVLVMVHYKDGQGHKVQFSHCGSGSELMEGDMGVSMKKLWTQATKTGMY
jgi:hypothetical protein